MDARGLDLIREIADRVASLEEEKDELAKDIAAEIAAAKDKGLDPVELRAAIANRRKRNKDPDKYDHKETTRAQYELALGMPSYSGILDEPVSARTRMTAVIDPSFDKSAAH
jgi:uncharacterized protein (UPF0335 family)